MTIKAIPGHSGYFADEGGGIWSAKRQPLQKLATFVGVKGYINVILSDEGVSKNYRVHRLVLLTFVGPCPEGYQGSHLNGNPADNRLVNLIWESHMDNQLRKKTHGTQQRGGSVGTAVLTAESVQDIVRRVQAGETQRKLAREYGVHKSNVYAIVKGKSWSWLTGCGTEAV